MKKLILATIALVISLGINSQNQAQCTGHQQGKRCNIERNSVQSPEVKATMRVNKIAEAVELTKASLRKNARMIYIGAGTSGRMGLMDAVECVPTFSSENVIGLIAGGEGAFIKAVEGAEDSK